MRIKLRNRLHQSDGIASATIQFVNPSTGAMVLAATTNNHGVAVLNPAALPAGTFTCRITAPNVFADPVGPALLTAGPIPERIYRPVTLTVVRTAAGIASATPTNAQHAATSISGNVMTVDIQPVWMRSATNSGRGGQPVSMIVVHHTGCNVGIAVNTFLVEKGPHYMIDTDGQIVKWVQDFRAAWHAGEARWAGNADINSRSIGIEIVHSGGSYTTAQYNALLELITRIRTAFSTIGAWDVVGHSDVGTNPSGRLGRKSGDPGSTFEWARLEARNLGLQKLAGPPSPTIYAGFFQYVPNGSLRRGDNDSHHRFGGSAHPQITGSPVQELQEDLAAIGYSVGTPDGDFGERSHAAVVALQEHFFAGGRGHKPPDGRVDFLTAGLIKSVAGAAAILGNPVVAGAGAGAGATGP